MTGGKVVKIYVGNTLGSAQVKHLWWPLNIIKHLYLFQRIGKAVAFLGQSQYLVLRFETKINTKVAFQTTHHPPPQS